MIMNIAMEELMGPGDHAMMIVKGRRTKRARPSPSSDDGGDAGGEISSLCSDEISTSTEEDEDMANCLILLAQSGNCSSSSRQEEPQEAQATKNNNNNNNNREKISSKKFTEFSTATMGKAGVYVYECKTCNRSFPSFQALGGHRASHKKPKQTANEEHHHHHQQQRQHNPCAQTSVNSNNKKKIHECSICGVEFSSGQALGGHMRRHRIASSTITTSVISKVTTSNDTVTTVSSQQHDGERPRTLLQLDLNLPAPPEDDLHHDSKFQFSASQQHLFSSPALVDCHY